MFQQELDVTRIENNAGIVDMRKTDSDGMHLQVRNSLLFNHCRHHEFTI